VACRAAEQMPAVRQQRTVAHRLPLVRLLSWAPGIDARREVAVWAMDATRGAKSLQFSLCNQTF
jgi:hypothetical protein